MRTENWEVAILGSLFKTKEKFESIFAIESPVVWLEGIFGSECAAVGFGILPASSCSGVFKQQLGATTHVAAWLWLPW